MNASKFFTQRPRSTIAGGLLFILAVAITVIPAASAQGPAPGTTPRVTPPERTRLLDRVVAIVNDDAITQFDIEEQKRIVLQQMKAQSMAPPPAEVFDKQLLERLITERALLQFAKETGVRVDDVQVERTLTRIAQENKLTAEQLQKAIEAEGMSFARYREDMRNEVIMQRLRERDVEGKIFVSETEVDNFVATQNVQSGGDNEYLLSHILVLVPEQANSEQINTRRLRAEEALRRVNGGAEFGQVAAAFSDASDALSGGGLGWRGPARLPSVFAEQVRTMSVGQVSGILRSATAFHIVKLQDKRSRNEPTVVEQTHARHILIRVSETSSDLEAKSRLERIRDRIDTGLKFDDQARLYSEDASSVKGGDLGWISPGDTVADFESAMGKLKIGELSMPIRSPFGWHLIQVSERRTQDVTTDLQRNQARVSLRQRKSDEAFQDWVRQMRDRAYVEIKVDER